MSKLVETPSTDGVSVATGEAEAAVEIQKGSGRTRSLDIKGFLQSYVASGEATVPKRSSSQGTEEMKRVNSSRSGSDRSSTSYDSDPDLRRRFSSEQGYSSRSQSRSQSGSYFSKPDDDTSLSSDTETSSNSSSEESSLEAMSVEAPKEEAEPEMTAAEKAAKRWAELDDLFRRRIQYVYMFATLYGIPIGVAWFSAEWVVSIVYYISLGAIAFVNGWMLAEAVSAFYYTKKVRDVHHSSPELIGDRRLGAVISAYLPNELSVLIDTTFSVARLIECLPDTCTLDVIISHNGGSKEQRIQLLEGLVKIENDLPGRVLVHELNVVSSKSKAENVNAGLAFLEYLSWKRGLKITQIAMYDADHEPIPEAYLYALETMQDQKCDMVMGRCCVREGFKFIAVEFDILYGVAHAGGRMVRGFGFFGGSNGYWDYQTLQDTGMDEGMLTEDVDSSFRAQADGHRMTYDPTIVSFEEAPPSLFALWKQRLRWSQGWGEVTVRQFTLWFRKAPGLTLWSRFCIFLLLPFREIYAYMSSYTVPIAVVYLSKSCGIACIDYRLIGFLVFCAQVPIFMTWAAWYLTKDRVTGIHYRMPTMKRSDYFWYILVSYIYELAKVHISVLGHARNFLGLNAWVVTKRKGSGGAKKEDDGPAPVLVDRPESIVEDSPYAPPIRRLFSLIYDAREDDGINPATGFGTSGGKRSDSSTSSSSSSDDASATSFSIERMAI